MDIGVAGVVGGVQYEFAQGTEVTLDLIDMAGGGRRRDQLDIVEFATLCGAGSVCQHAHLSALTGQRFLEGFECLRALRGAHIRLPDLLPAFFASASPHDQVRTAAAAVLVLGMRLGRKPRLRRG